MKPRLQTPGLGGDVMRLHELMSVLPPRRLPPEDPEVIGIQHDSREVRGGDLFVAIVGDRFDGRSFVGQAVERGAVAVLGPGPAPVGLSVPWVEVAEPRSWLGAISSRLYGQPHEHLKLVGITGTNGKSTVTALVAQMLQASGSPCGVLGTLGRHFGDISYPPSRTTPEACDVYRTFDEMRAGGARAVVMEVSSHALSLGRVAGVAYDVAVFTNLTRDHLDFHGDLETYFAAKRALFDQLKSAGRPVVSIADDYGRRLAEELDDPLTFGPGGDVTAGGVQLDLRGIRGSIVTPRGKLRFESRLVGRYNLENLLAAVAAAEALGLPHEAIAAGIAKQEPLPGRLEPVDAGQPFPALVDYAHTPAALEAALRSVGELTDRKIVLVFGCGGDRDPGKRPIMGKIAGELAALPVVTSDNPRSEDPQAIMLAVEEGLRASGNSDYRMVPDRREAIRRAATVASTGEGWMVLVAGRGHENLQLAGDQRIPFVDFDELRTALRDAREAKTKAVHADLLETRRG